MQTPDDLKAFMLAQQIDGQILQLEVPTPTVPDAARAVGVQVGQIVKSVLFTIDGRGVMTITCGIEPVERRAVAAEYGVGRKRVKLAPPEVVLALTGYPVGTVPPFGHPEPLPTLLDPAVLEHDQVYAGGGAHNALVRLNPRDILAITDAKMIPLHSRPA